MYKYLFEVMLSILWHKYAEVDLLGPIIDYFILKILYLISWVILYFFLEWQYHFTDVEVDLGSNFSTSSPTLVILFFFVFQYHSNPFHCEEG